MKTMIRKIVVLTLSLALITNTGCASVRTIEGTEAAVVEHNVKVGDDVRLYRTGHPTELVRILKLSESELTATRQDGTVIVVDWRDIHTLGNVKTDPDNEWLFVVGVSLLSVAVIAYMIFYALSGFGG